MRYFRYKVILILVIFKMKKIWLLTTLCLLLTGCNNQQYEEEFSEYWLLQWPNGTITLEDFKKEWNIINESEVDNWTGWKICSETPETACVPVILKENEILVTPHEYNEFIAEETDLPLLEEPYYTDLKTFRKVTWLKEASPEYVEWELPGSYIFDAYTKFYKTKAEREAMLKEKIENQTIEEPVDEIPDDFDGCNRYFDWCNRCTLQDDWEVICTEEACEVYQEAYCADEQYDEFLEDIRSNIPLCNDIDLNRNTEYTYIDNVVENCTYEEWTAYSYNWWWCWWVMPHLYITKDRIWYFDIVADDEHPIICNSPRAWIIKSLSGDFEDLATFWYKHGISKKALINTLEARTDEEVFRNWCWYYFCNGDICEQFYRPSYWENENHYYIYWYRHPKNGPYETVLLVDDKLYMLGQSENMFDEDSRPNPIKQWKWVVYWLDWDKLIVKRYVDWELIPPYTLENYSSYSFDEPTTTTKFKIKTCEISL